MKRVSSLVGVAAASLLCFTSYAFAADGWASMNGDTTGGAGGIVVTVDNATDLEYYAELGTTPYIIQVSGTIDISDTVEIRSNKTLIGLDSNSTLIGQLGFRNRDSNIIIENLNITNPDDYGEGDGISLKQDINNVLITKCTIYDCTDGCLDITNRSDYITVSWCKFYYDTVTNHRYVNLVGATDNPDNGDPCKLNVTFHHNWWSTNCYERMPRVRFGKVHIYNNYYDCHGNSYCVRPTMDCQILAENNYFDHIDEPIEYNQTGATVEAHDNIYDGCTHIQNPGTDDVFDPPYSYTLNDAADVPAVVQVYAGAGTPYPPHWLTTVYGDFDRNGVVDENDLRTFAGYWLATTDIDDADYDGDGNVNFYEFSLLAENWF